MTDLRQAAQRLIDVIEREGASPLDWPEYDALKAALEQSEASAQRTLRQLGYTDCGGEFWKPPLGKAAQPEQQAEPVAYMHKETGLLRREIGRPKGADWDANYWEPLYTTPPHPSANG